MSIATAQTNDGLSFAFESLENVSSGRILDSPGTVLPAAVRAERIWRSNGLS